MDDNVVYYVDLEKARKKAKFREKVIEPAKKVLEWCDEHKEILLVVVPAAVGLGTTIVKNVGKGINLRKEQMLKENYCYDRSLGMYWKLKRALTNQEWQAIDRRKANGERLGNILSDMNVLK